jgi:hypothetical protein
LTGDGFVLTDAPNGVVFDIAGTGKPMKMAWTAAGVENAFLGLPGVDGLVHPISRNDSSSVGKKAYDVFFMTVH